MAKAPKTTTAPTGQIAPFGLRMLPELKEKIEQSARESGRSMNAEIVARLEASLDPENNPATLKQRILELEGDAALGALHASQAKSDLLAAQLLVVQIAKMCPPGVIPKDSVTSQLLQRTLDKEGDLIKESIENMIDGLLNVKGAIDKRIESGQLKVVADSEGPTGFTYALDKLKDLGVTIEEMNEILEKSPEPKR